MLRDILDNKLFVSLTALFFFLVFSLNIMGTLDTDSFIENDKFSESLVSNQIKCKGQIHHNQLIGLKYPGDENKQECIEENYIPYNVQFGLQGKIGVVLDSILEKVLHTGSFFTIIIYQLLAALLSAILFALLVLWIKLQFGLTVAITSAVLIALSPMLVSFSRNLYWSLPLMIAPIIYILYFYRPSLQKKEFILFLLGLMLLLYARYLCGYEYVTTITIMTLSLAIYTLVLARSKRKKIIRHLILIGLTSVVAMLLALSTHVVFLNGQTQSTHESIEIITKRAQERTIGGEDYTNYAYKALDYVASDFYKTSNIYIQYDKLKDSGSLPYALIVAYTAHLLIPVVHIPILGGVLGGYIQSFLVFLVILLLLYKYRSSWVNANEKRQVKAIYAVLLLGLLGYFSWLILAYSHSLVHAFLNGILMYLPTALFGFIIIGLYLKFLINKYVKRIK